MKHSRIFHTGLVFVFISALAVLFLGNRIFPARSQGNVPENVRVTAVSACAFDIVWDQANPSLKFDIQAAVDETFSGPNIVFPATSERGVPISGSGIDMTAFTSSELTGLPGGEFYTPGNSYYFRIRSYPAPGVSSAYSAPPVFATANALPAAPGAPENVIAESLDNGNRLFISWSTSTEPSARFNDYGGFEIWAADSSDGGNTYSEFTLRARTSPFQFFNGKYFGEIFTDPSRSYRVYIIAYESDRGCKVGEPGQQAASPPSSEALVPSSPANLSGEKSGSAITLTWEDRASGTGNETYFEIWRAVGTSANYGENPLGTAPADETSFVDTDFTEGEEYTYKVRACDFSGSCSAFSNEFSIVAGVSIPDDFEGGIVYVYADGNAADTRFSWTARPGLMYTLERNEVGSSERLIPAGCSGLGIASCRDIAVPTGKRYEYVLTVTDPGTGEFISLDPVELNLNLQIVLNGVGWSALSDNGADYTGIGWIRFNSGGEPIRYSVQVDNTGLFSGIAWSSVVNGSGYGWLSFNVNDLDGCPSAPCEARLNLATGEVSGWARFLAPVPPENKGQETVWNGWVRLSGITENGIPYGVRYDEASGLFTEAAWGGDVAGWIVFGGTECSFCSVIGERFVPDNERPLVSGVVVEAGPEELWCAEVPYYRVIWNYSDPEGDPQASAIVRFERTANNTIDFETTFNGLEQSYRLNDPLASLQANVEYVASVRVFDGIRWSEPASSTPFITPLAYYPLVDFEWDPASSLAAGDPVQFTDLSVDRSGAGITAWKWTFQNSPTMESTAQNPSNIIFSAFPANVTLEVTDGNANACTLIKTIESGGSEGGSKRKIFRELN